MRVIAAILGIAVLVLIAAVLFGFVSFDQTRHAVVQAPAFKMNVGKVALGKETKTVEVPTLSVQKPENTAAPAQ